MKINRPINFPYALQAEWEIKNSLQNYCRGVDRRDFDLVRAVYHEDAVDEHGPYNGNIDGLIAWMTCRHQGVSQSMHLIANCMIDWVNENIANVETYCVTYQRLSKEHPSSVSDVGLTVGGIGQQTQVRCRYLDRFENRGDGWKIAHRMVAYDSLLLEDADESQFSSNMLLSTRGINDPLYTLLGKN